jgi:hypothetical protein
MAVRQAAQLSNARYFLDCYGDKEVLRTLWKNWTNFSDFKVKDNAVVCWNEEAFMRFLYKGFRRSIFSDFQHIVMNLFSLTPLLIVQAYYLCSILWISVYLWSLEESRIGKSYYWCLLSG